MDKRKRLTREERIKVLEKTGWCCAYCGIELDFDSFQVDHVIPMRLGGADELDNMLPACRNCNHYKRGNSLEGWRKMIEKIGETLWRDSYTYRQAVRFGQVVPTPKKVKFYFEWIQENT